MPDSNFVLVETPQQLTLPSLGTRQFASIDALNGGGFVVAYQDEIFPGTLVSNPEIYFQLYDANGVPSGSPVQVNTTTTADQIHPSVVVLNSGEFVVTWVDTSGADSDGYGIYSQRFSAAGAPIGGETLVNTSVLGTQTDPDTFALAGGGHVVVWTTYYDDGAGTVTADVNIQRYDSAGAPDGTETTIASYVSTGDTSVSAPEIVELSGGNLAISFTRYVFGLGGDAYSQLAVVTNTGVAVSGVIDPEQTADDAFTLPQIRIVELGNGNFIAAWGYSYGATGAVNVGYSEIYARIYDSTGTAVGNEFLVYGGVNNRRFDIFANSDGEGGAIIGFVQEDDSVNERALIGQQVSQTGALIGEPLWFNQNQGSQWRSGEIVALANGDLAVVHQTGGGGGVSQLFTQLIANGNDMRFSTGDDVVMLANTGEQVVGLEGADTIAGGADGETLNGQVGDDFIFGRGGADVITGGVGLDFVDGGLGDDNIFGEGDNDTLIGGLGSDTIYGGDNDDFIYGYRSEHHDLGPNDPDRDVSFTNYLFGDGGEDRIEGGDGTDWIYGGSEDDVLLGGGGSDLMFGEGGADILNGGDGIDYMWGGDGGDTFYGLDGADWIRGEAGIDRLNGGNGDDVLIGGTETDHLHGDGDTDTLYGEDGNDFLYGDAGGDVLFGQDGNDTLRGGSEGDFLFGGTGTDTIIGGTENDLMWGDMPGSGDGVQDIFDFDANWGFDAIYDFELGIDQINMGGIAGLTQFSDLTVFDGGANVTVVFGADAITLYGVTLAQLNANQSDFDFT